MKSTQSKSRLKRGEALTGILFVIPSLLMWSYWFLFPAIKSMRLSFYEYSYIRPEEATFVGFDNFKRLFADKKFLASIQHSLFLVVCAVILLTVLSFSIALLLQSNIKGKTFFRTSYYMPYVISSVAVSIFFMYFFIKGGVGSTLFSFLGLKNTTWFTDTKYALIFVLIIYIWQQIGFYMILYISGLQSISRELYEAAEIDGANGWKKTRYITIPLVKPTTYMVITLCMINSFQIFDQIAAISKQNPLGSPAGSTSTMVTFLYQQSFSYMDMGYGSAAAMVLVVFIFGLSMLRNFLTKEEA